MVEDSASRQVTAQAQGPRTLHPLAVPSRRWVWVVVLIGWLAMIGWSPEQILAVLLAIVPGVVGTDAAK
ncbi:hypothetical protein ABH926_004273 [Catenulispora sp. GP43]|uniref:hypothetical protein n=1 Tax=Catenulispora sp. GP43 TaxID=3156263 RepID=UPI0035167BEE